MLPHTVVLTTNEHMRLSVGALKQTAVLIGVEVGQFPQSEVILYSTASQFKPTLVQLNVSSAPGRTLDKDILSGGGNGSII